jgi:hypothetical protein
MKPGTRVVSHAWDMGEWEPDTTQRVGDGEAFLWIVPARVEGRWALRDASGFFTGELVADQRFQRVGGTLDLRATCNPCSARMSKATSSASRSSPSTAACAASAPVSMAARSPDRSTSRAILTTASRQEQAVDQ